MTRQRSILESFALDFGESICVSIHIHPTLRPMILHRFTQLHQAPRALGRRLLSAAAPAVSEIKTVGCVGLGLMGHGIAQLSASAGYGVVAVETSEAAIEVGRGRIETSLSKLLGKSVKKGKLTEEEAAAQQAAALANISYSTDVAALADCDLIVEAIIEDINIKVPFYERGRRPPSRRPSSRPTRRRWPSPSSKMDRGPRVL